MPNTTETLPAPSAPTIALSPADFEQQLENLRRSPHPYHRRRQNGHTYTPTPELRADATISDEDGRKRRKQSTSPSASGTEADDEGYNFVKALPAPPLRPRKGLRDIRGSGRDGDATPLLTPSLVDEEGRRYSAEYFRARRAEASTSTDEEVRAAREKYRRRRRNELVRRTTETALLGFIGILAVWGCRCWTQLWIWHRELLTHGLVVVGLLALYPARLFFYSSRRQKSQTPNGQRRPWLRVPSAFDPATILYPTFLPVLISISLHSPMLEHTLLPNLLLGLAAMPARLIPYSRTAAGYSELHWLLSILPLFASENTDIFSKISATTPYKLKLPQGLDSETLVCLFALHHALLPPLYYLTTTSLLPTELQLLSVGLINLLLFAKSPHAVILKTLLWLGGLGLFVLCGRVLSWGVALARIPRWRFRNAANVVRTKQSFISSLMKSRSKVAQTGKQRGGSDSDADEDHEERSWAGTSVRRREGNGLGIALTSKKVEDGYDAFKPHNTEPRNSGDHPNGDENTNPKTTSQSRQQPNTLPTPPPQVQDFSSKERPQRTRNRRTRAKSSVQSFLAFTHRQATIRKWAYAAYFYLVVLALILGPIRWMIQHYALSGHEPFGWAIGYLFGNIRAVRFQIVNWDLESWIPLPDLLDESPSSSPPGTGLVLSLTSHLNWIPVPQFIKSFLNTSNITPGPATTRLSLILYFALILITGLSTVLLLTPKLALEIDTRRKIFHFTMVALLLPSTYMDPAFVALALVLVLSLFLLADLVRASQLPPLSKPLARFLTPYVDGRDLRGPVVVSHIFLLVGCAVPVWLSLASIPIPSMLSATFASPFSSNITSESDPWHNWTIPTPYLGVDMLAGVICVGMGDAAASLVGRRFGRRKWPWAGGKSLEGSAAFAGAVWVGLVFGRVWLGVLTAEHASEWGYGGRYGGGDGGGPGGGDGWVYWGVVMIKAVVCAAGASLNEAVLTGGNDNVVVPVLLWVLVRGVGL